MTAEPLKLTELLRSRGGVDDPMDVILDSWPEVEDAVRADAGSALIALTAAADALPPLAGAVADRRALACAVLSARAEVCWADPAFAALFPDPSDLRPLLRRVLREGPQVTLVEGAAGAAFTAWIGDAAAAGRWPIDPEALAAAGPDRLVVVVGAPSRSSELARRAARTLDLTALEARLAEALLYAPNLEVAAADAGVGRETARDALRRINAKLGVRRTPELVARLISVMCEAQGETEDDVALAQSTFGLTPGEARVAAIVARGATAPETAATLGLSAQTVKSHIKAVLQKTGARGVKDLARLLAEARELVAVASASEPVFGEEEGGGRLRVIPALDGRRRIALIDYGPYDGEPLAVFHGSAAGRRLPEGLRQGLIDAGFRPIVVQRPGFGLTDPAEGEHHVVAAVDLASIVHRLKLRNLSLFARDTGVPTALEFARLYPDLVGRAVLMNPHLPRGIEDERTNFIAGVQKRLLRDTDLLEAFAELLRRAATSRTLHRILDRMLGEIPVDHAAAQDPEVREFLIRDIHALCARSMKGFAAEHATYATGWQPPRDLPDRPWTLALSTDLPGHVPPDWLPVARLNVVRIEGAGILPQFTHPDALIRLLVAAD